MMVRPPLWHYTGAAGPVGAALFVAARTEGRLGVRNLVAHFHPRRVPGGWLLFAISSPVFCSA